MLSSTTSCVGLISFSSPTPSFPHALVSSPTNQFHTCLVTLNHKTWELSTSLCLCLAVPAGWQGRVPALTFLAGSILLQGLVHSLLWKDPPSVSCYVYEPKVATVYWPPRFLSLYCRPRLIAPKHARAKLKFLHIQLLKQQQKTAQTNTFLAI